MNEWVDATSYASGRPRIPTTWSIQLGAFRLAITCTHIYFRDDPQWVMNMNPLWDAHQLNLPASTPTENLDKAKAKALALARIALSKALESIPTS